MATYDKSKLVNLGHLEKVSNRLKADIASAVAALPKEMFLDQTKTVFVQDFAFTEAAYPGATNPNLEHKPVLVLAVKGVDNSAPTDTTKQTVTYSFLDMTALVDIYTVKSGDSAKILAIANNEIEVKISSAANNAIKVKEDGLHVDIHVDGATNGHLAGLDASGNLTDSGIAASEVLVDEDVATDTDVDAMITEVFGEGE